MKVLVIGAGGREHALAWKVAASERVSEVVACPGNAGIAQVARVVSGPSDPDSLVALARSERPDLILIGPEAPLVAGAADLLSASGFRVFGPGRDGARLEGSKAYAKAFMNKYSIPTAAHASFREPSLALAYLSEVDLPVVVKDSALAAGKGVTIAYTREAAEEAVTRVLAREAGEVVIEQFLRGQEVSYLVFCDGRHWLPMPLAQDYKQADDGDTGPMTGGMGAVAPVDLLTEEEISRVEREIVAPTIRGLRAEHIDYRGVIYFGLMITEAGPKLLEYNVRFGDPETQVVMPLLASDLLDLLEACVDGNLATARPVWREAHSACVVMASPGYPGEYRAGVPLHLPKPPDGVMVFHAGTKREGSRLLSSGGRVLDVVATGRSPSLALELAYRHVGEIRFPDAKFRRDIGSRLR